MSHRDEGSLLALVDGELDAAATEEADEHLERCLACRERLDALRAERAVVRDAIAALDASPPEARVRQAVLARARGAARPASQGHAGDGVVPLRRRSWWMARSRLAQAALLVLLLAGGASALVLGPALRDRLSEAGAPDERASPALAPAVERTSPEVGTQVGPADGRITIALRGLPSGAEVHVVLVEGDGALVLAPAGTRFRSGNGRIEADAGGGPVRVELPNDLALGSLEVDGRTYLTVVGSVLRLEAAAFAQDASEARFRIP